MADEDEVDILGDFSLATDSGIFDGAVLVSQSSDLLNCDYTIHPQWLLDNTSANPANWYNTEVSTTLSSEETLSNFEIEQNTRSDNCITSEEKVIDDSGWTEKEKSLLERAIEIFGKSPVRLSQFIGSKTPSEVKYYLKHFYPSGQLSCDTEIILDESITEETFITSDETEPCLHLNQVLSDNEIPASIEEVIAVVSTAKPTVSVSPKRLKCKKKDSRNYDEHHLKTIPYGHSLLKSTHKDGIERTSGKFENRKKAKIKNKMRIVNDHLYSSDKKCVSSRNNKSTVKFQFRIDTAKKQNKEQSFPQDSPALKRGVEIVTGKGLSVPLFCGEEVIKIKKENDIDLESDVEIDVEDFDRSLEDTETDDSAVSSQNNNLQTTEHVDAHNNFDRNSKKIANVQADAVVSDKEDTKDHSRQDYLKTFCLNISDSLKDLLMGTEIPTEEVVLGENEITDLEKTINHDFFEGRPTKTIDRYLTIRNHIINCWTSSKPNYITKTSIRQGLRYCGDVNCIGRIHCFLEQIGAINFGCSQTNYIRPLCDMLATTVYLKDKPSKDLTKSELYKKSELGRSRHKKKFTNDGEGGYTMTHDEKGDVIKTTVINEEPVVKSRVHTKKPFIRLIYCRPFTDEHPQKYKVKIQLSALLLMDLHSHSSLSEVMGLIGGNWSAADKTLTITVYEPCRNIAPSATHCDMCPVSQAKAADVIHNEGLAILGWFHSHPTFAPEPSQQDLDTQLSVQQWIGNNKPCIGLILSPFSLQGALIASPYRCLIVDRKDNFEDQYVPYKFRVELNSSKFDVNRFLNSAWRIFNSEVNMAKENKVDFMKMYAHDVSLTYLDKFISSVKMHLAKCTDINKMTCDAVVHGLSEICCKYV